MEQKKKPVVLLILDGWGSGREDTSNAIFTAKKPTLDFIEQKYPSLLLHASGIAVGVLWGDEGNSETGHITLGLGRIIYQYIPRIIFSVRDGSFFRNKALIGAVNHIKKNNGSIHLMGLVSSGSVHSYVDHIYALFEFTKNENIKNVFLHVFTDGKDAAPQEGKKFIENIQARLNRDYPNIKIATISGRFYGMDRANNWDRTEKIYNLMTQGDGKKIKNIEAHFAECYENNISDEFIEPAIIVDEKDEPISLVRDNDALIFFNFREDSARQISRAFTEENFTNFDRKKINNLYFCGITKYEDDFKGHVIFEPIKIVNCLGEILSNNQKRQLRIAETEKYAHVTYFFNGGQEKPFLGEDRILVQSLPLRHFEETPEMKAEEITNNVIKSLDGDVYDVIIVNFANADMVGHTGNFDSIVAAVEIVDKMISRIMQKVLSLGGHMIITADHGNADYKLNTQSGSIMTKHSINPVPFYLVSDDYALSEPPSSTLYHKNPSGFLSDVAPTILEIMGIPKPPEMTGNSLLSVIKFM